MESTYSYWERETYFENIDVAVIGSGIVGLSAAMYLKKKHKKLKIAIIDRGVISLGASTRNAGFACFGSAGEILDDLKTSSEDTVFSLVERRWKGLQRLRKNIGDKALDFHKWGGYEIFSSQREYDACRDRLAYLNQHTGQVNGIKETYRVAGKKIALFGFNGVKGMIVNVAEGQLNTGMMMHSMMERARRAGIYFVNGFEVADMDNDGRLVRLKSAEGIDITCRRALLCTNGYTGNILPELAVKPARAQVLITRPIKNLPLKGVFHFDKGYYYFRNIDGRILLGGGRNLDFKTEETAVPGLTEVVQRRLEDLLHTMIAPYCRPEIQYRWSGIMGVGADKTTIIKQVKENIFCAVRLGGMGVAIGSLAGEEAAEMVEQSL